MSYYVRWAAHTEILPRLSCCVNSGNNQMECRGLIVVSGWSQSGGRVASEEAAGGKANKVTSARGEVADARWRKSEIFLNALMMNQQWRRKQMAWILNTSLLWGINVDVLLEFSNIQ